MWRIWISQVVSTHLWNTPLNFLNLKRDCFQNWQRGIAERVWVVGVCWNNTQVVNTAIMTALSLGGHWQQCLHIATSLEGSLSQTTGNVLATSLQRSAQWTLVLALLQQMEKKQGFLRKCTADAITYSAAIAACGVGGHWRNALDLYGKVSPQNSILLNVAITVCGENLQWQKALQLVSNKLSDTISYNSAITACGNAGRWQHALALFALMPRKVRNPSKSTWHW